VWDAHPYIGSYGALPILPGVVLSYHEYQLAGHYGCGRFELTVWYGAGVVSVGALDHGAAEQRVEADEAEPGWSGRRRVEADAGVSF
jgi:hypothetical protein